MKAMHKELLAAHTTLGVGGPTSEFFRAESEGDLLQLVASFVRSKKRFTILGGGSNVVIADQGLDHPVVQIATRGVEVLPQEQDEVRVTASAGEPWDAFVETCVTAGFCGLECLSGIPGLVGATPMQNVGAYGQQVSDCIESVRCYDLLKQCVVELSNQACGFCYRSSIFKTSQRGRYLVLGVCYRLRRGAPEVPRYQELKRSVGPLQHGALSLATIRNAVLALRRGKAMVIDQADPDSRSVGSFFLNPVICLSEADRAEQEARRRGKLEKNEHLPRFGLTDKPEAGDKVKVPAAWLIERAGFSKGYHEGPVGLSRKHALAIVNRGGATAAQVVALANKVRNGVRDAFGIELHPEPIFLGFSDPDVFKSNA